MAVKQQIKKAYLKSNIWGNYYLIVNNKKVRDWKGKPTNKPEIFEWINANYPDRNIIDKTEY